MSTPPLQQGLLTLNPTTTTEKSSVSKTRSFRLHRRFDRMGRLVGDPSMEKLFSSHAMVVGIGGVGSWAAESLIRAGVGRLTLVDFDLVCVTNTNRQLHAIKGNTGRSKVEVMADRLRAIHPSAEVMTQQQFYEKDNSEEILSSKPDIVLDAIDNLSAKTHLIATCKERGIPIVVSGGASGRLDPTQIEESDLAKVRDDPFLAQTRKLLRKHYAFPEKAPWGIRAIHSREAAKTPIALNYDSDEGFQCVCPQGRDSPHSCERRNVIYGTAGFVTGSFGLACGAAVTRLLLEEGQ